MTKINFSGEVNVATENIADCVSEQLKSLTVQHGGNINLEITTDEDISRLKKRIAEIVKDNYLPNSDGGIEIYCDYRDELSDKTIKEIVTANNPREAFYEILSEMDIQYEDDYFIKTIVENLTDDEKKIYFNNEDELGDFIHESYFFYYPAEHFNKDIHVNIMLDTGNMNYDFTCDNVLNWEGQRSEGKFEKDSSMLWLAKQQGKAELLQKCCAESMRKWANDEQDYKEVTECTDKFVVSAMHELANLSSHMGTMTFLVGMDLFTYFELLEAIKDEENLNKSYELEQRKGTGYIVLDKSTMCGLFDTWQGGGSLLEVECEKDIVIPIRCIFNAVVDGTKIYGWDVDSVYGLTGDCWDNTLKEIHSMAKTLREE